MFKIPAYERKVVWLLFAFSLSIATSYVVARTIGDSLFLSRIGNQQLALVFVFSGITTAVVAAAWYFLTKKFSVVTAIKVSSFAFAFLTLLTLFLLPNFHHSFWLLAAIYLMADVKGCINAINIVSALNTKLGRDASASSWAVVGLAAPTAAVVIGALLAVESSAISIQAWLVVGLCLDVTAMGIGFYLGRCKSVKALMADLSSRSIPESLPSKSFGGQTAGGIGSPTEIAGKLQSRILGKSKTYVCSNEFRKWIGVLIAAKVVVLTIVAFEWKTAVNTFFLREADSLVWFFGVYYGAVGVATILVQLFATRRLLKQRSLALPILLMPALLLIVSVLIMLSPVVLAVLIFTTFGKSLDVWRRSVHDTTLNFLYTRIRRGQRRSAISINSGFVKPLSEVSAALVIFFGSALVYRSVLMVVLVVWILAAIQLLKLVKPSRSPAKSDHSRRPQAGARLVQT